MNSLAPPIPSSAAASFHGAATPSLELLEARQLRDALKILLRKERAAMAEFLAALADFDRHHGWEPLGHASLFAFLRAELGLSSGAAFWRMSAARLLQRFPDLVEPLRDGRLCLTTTAELAKVLTEENRVKVLPRFFGLSAREAKEVVAELQPREAPATRAVVTAVARSESRQLPVVQSGLALTIGAAGPQAPSVVPPTQLRAPETTATNDARRLERHSEVEPLTGEQSRLHVTVSRTFLKKLDAARVGLSHQVRAATPEQVLEAALDLLLEKQARSRGLVKKPRSKVAATMPAQATSPAAAPARRLDAPPVALVPTEPPPPRRAGPREAIPAAVKRAVWERDHGRCAWPIDGGGSCGSTHRLEFDHVVPWARWGPPTVEGIRLVCRRHNVLAARLAFGSSCVDRYAKT